MADPMMRVRQSLPDHGHVDPDRKDEQDKDREGHAESAKRREPSEEEHIAQEVRAQAFTESRAYFQTRADRAKHILETRHEQVENLMDRMKSKEQLTLDDVYVALGLDVNAEQDRSIATAVVDGLKRCEPIFEVDSAIVALNRYVEDAVSPARNAQEQREGFDAGTSWYHTTEEGQHTLHRIEKEVRARHAGHGEAHRDAQAA